MTKKLLTIIGARPQFIKAAALSRVIAGQGDVIEVLVHTGQHYDSNMSDVFFEQMGIPLPAFNLAIGGGTHGAMTGRQLEKIEEILFMERPDWVIVYGDTNSTLAGAIAASKVGIPIAHIEAGLRSFNRRMPEEINRVLTDHASTLLFAPTTVAKNNLLVEGIDESRIFVVGDLMYDAALFYKSKVREPEWFSESHIEKGQYVLCTIHRAENTDDVSRMRSILQGLGEAKLPVVLPLHPRTRRILKESGLQLPSNIYATDPVGYLEMVWLETHCRLVATDSGGVQKEAYFHKKPCITLRDETEWVELLAIGANRLVGVDAEKIAASLFEPPIIGESEALYGTGDSASQILQIIRTAE